LGKNSCASLILSRLARRGSAYLGGGGLEVSQMMLHHVINGVCIHEPNKIDGAINLSAPPNGHGNCRQAVRIGRPTVVASNEGRVARGVALLAKLTKDPLEFLGLKRQFVLGIAGPSQQIEQAL